MIKGNIKRRRKNSTLSKVSNDSKPLLTMQFSTMLRKMKQKKREQLKIKMDEENEEYEKQVEQNLNSRQAKLENEKHLIKLYDSNYSSLFDTLKKEYYNEDNKNLATTQNNYKVSKNKFGFSQPKTLKYGFEQFNRTSYTNHSCMKEFYNKYSQYNTLTRKYPIQHFTPSWAFIKSSKEEKIIPNPLGLVKRSGDDRILGINNQKVGDN